jgi:hypothetical protein
LSSSPVVVLVARRCPRPCRRSPVLVFARRRRSPVLVVLLQVGRRDEDDGDNDDDEDNDEDKDNDEDDDRDNDGKRNPVELPPGG